MNRTYCDVCGAEFVYRDIKSFKAQVKPGYPGRTAGEIEFEITLKSVNRPLSSPPYTVGSVIYNSVPTVYAPAEIKKTDVHVCFRCLLETLSAEDDREKRNAASSADFEKTKAEIFNRKKAKK